MADLQAVTVYQVPVLFLARGLGSAEDAKLFCDIVAEEFPAPLLEPTLRKKAEPGEARLANSKGDLTEFTRDPVSNIEEIVGALKERTTERGGDIFLGTISNVEEAERVKKYGVKGGVSPETFMEVVDYALENGMEYYPAVKNIDAAYTLVAERPAQKFFKFFEYLTKKPDQPTIENFTPNEILEFTRQNPDAKISVTGGIKTKEEIKDLLRINYELGFPDDPRVFVGMGIYAGAPAPVADVKKSVQLIALAVRELEVQYGIKLGKRVEARIPIGPVISPPPFDARPA